MLFNIKTCAATAALTLLPVVAQAAPVIYFAEDATTAGTGLGANSTVARNNFLSNLSSGVGVEDFESFTSSSPQPYTVSFPGSTGSLTATLGGSVNIDSSGPGRFPTSGNWFLEAHTGSFAIDFGSAVSAFGFNGVDIGDFVMSQMTIQLTDTSGALTSYTVNHSLGLGNNDNATLFWGFTDTATAYTRLEFFNAGGGDTFAFDDMVVGDLGQITPPNPVSAPGSLLLLGLGAALMGLRRGK